MDDDKGDAKDGPAELNRVVREAWERNAAFWDAHMGEHGNAFHRELVAPTAERLLELQPGEEVLEIACGAGLFARRMAEVGAQVTATDFSAAFLERARARCAGFRDRVEFRQVDGTNERQLLSLGEGRFDAAVSNMALMDMAAIEPLMNGLARLLKPGGRFVFTLMHPCFNTSGCARQVEEQDEDGGIRTAHSIRVFRYRTLAPVRGLGIRGQPVPHLYFHRALTDLFGPCFRAGFAIDGLEEPYFTPPEDAAPALDMRRFSEFPMVLGARARLVRG